MDQVLIDRFIRVRMWACTGISQYSIKNFLNDHGHSCPIRSWDVQLIIEIATLSFYVLAFI